MWRFLLPASMLVGALIVLLAGALGDLKSLPDTAAALRALAGIGQSTNRVDPPVFSDKRNEATKVEPTLTVIPQQPPPPQQPARPQQQQQQDGELLKSISQHSQELASLRASIDQAKRDLDVLQQKRRTEEAAAAKPPPPAHPAPNPAPPSPAASAEPQHAPSAPSRSDEAATRAALARAKTATATQPEPTRPWQPPTQPFGSSPAPTAQAGPAALPPPSTILQHARQSLAVGRFADARQLLVQAQAQSALQPVTPDRPDASGTNETASRIGDAIRWLDAGNTTGAMHAINMAMGNSTGTTQVWSGYSPPAPVGYGYGRQRP